MLFAIAEEQKGQKALTGQKIKIMQLWLLLRRICRCVKRQLPMQNSEQGYSGQFVRVPLLAVLLVFVSVMGASVFYTRAGVDTRVYAATSSTLNFQSRLSRSAGNIVADGNYHIEFKLYSVATGGSALWTETRTTGSLVRVVNGYMSVQLGSVNQFPSTIDWSQEHWLTMNVGGSDASPTWDGEMNPRIKLTAVPYAFRADMADRLKNGSGSLTADSLFQTTPLNLQTVDGAVAGLRFNQVGTGGLVQMQSDGADVLTVDRNGNAYFKGALDIDGPTLNIGSSSQAGSIVLNDGAGRTGLLQLGSLTGNRTYSLPNASGTICLTTTCGGGNSLSFVQGGNDFGELAVLGTNDTFGLSFRTNGTNKMTILPNGNVGIGNAAPNSLFSVGAGEQFTVSSTGALSTTAITSSGALSVTSGGASIQGGLNNNSGGITNAGSITGIGSNITAAAGLTIASGSAGDLVLDSASNKLVIAGSNSVIQRVGAGAMSFDLSDSGTTALVLTNSGTGIANLNIAEGALQIAGTSVLGNNRVLQNVSIDAGLITNGALAPARGGTGIDASAAANGQLLIGNGSGFSLGGISNSGGLSITNGAGSIGIAVNYGSSAGTAVQGNTTLVCSSGSGNLSGGGNTITLGSGGTCNALSIVNNPAFSSVSASTFSSDGALAISSGGSGDITFNSASNKLVIDGSDTSLQRTGSGSFTIDLNDSAATTLVLNNSGTGSASLNIAEGALQIAGTQIISNTRAVSGITGLSSSGTITFTGLSGGGLLKTDTSGNVVLATPGTDYETALAFANGLTRTGNNIRFGGALTADTEMPLAGFNMAFSGSGKVLIGTASGPGKLTIADSEDGDSLFINKTSGTGNILTLQRSGSGVFTIFNNGATQINTVSSAALEVRNTSGVNFFTVNTSGNLVQIGSSTANTNPILFVLNSFNSSSDPTGVNGAQYYNAVTNKFRCYENGLWKDCISGPDSTDVTLTSAANSISVTLPTGKTLVKCYISYPGRSANSTINMNFNNVITGSLYGYNVLQNLNGTSQGTSAQSSSAANQIQLNGTSSTTAAGTMEININNFPNTVTAVDWTGSGYTAGGMPNNFKGSGGYNSTSGNVTSVQFSTSSGNFNAGTRAYCQTR